MVSRNEVEYNLGSEIFSIKVYFKNSYQQFEANKWITIRQNQTKNKL